MRAGIIAALAASTILLGGCGMLRLAYGQADTIAFRWLDGYVDFDEAQAVQVRAGLETWFGWHRRTQLADYAAWLGELDAALPDNTTAEAVCGWWWQIRQRLDVGLDRAVPSLAGIAVSLKPGQLANIERRYAKVNREYREQYLQADPMQRRKEALKRVVERAESIYGTLDEAQRARLSTWLNDSPFDARIALEERLRRQQDSMRLLRSLTSGHAGADQAQAGIRAYLQEFDRSPREAYRRHQAEVIRHNCKMTADLHNSTTPAQRQAASRKLRGWVTDLRALSGQPGV